MMIAGVGALLMVSSAPSANAQSFYVPPNRSTPPPEASENNGQFSAAASLFDLGSNFLQRLGKNATSGYDAALRSNPGGGGAPADEPQPRIRSWAEGYALTSRTGAQGTFVGDKRETFGGVAGIGANLGAGFNAGVSVDQSRTKIQVPLAGQDANLDLTQIGVHATYETGPWTFAVAGIHGFGKISSTRTTIGGPALASYDGKISGALAEVNYYWGIGQMRIVPKLAVEYTRSSTDAFREAGGLLPIAASAAQAERARVLIGAEIGHYWILQQHVLDISGYAKFIDNFHQEMGPVSVSSAGGSIAVNGILESTTGVDVGGMISFGLTSTARAYLAYDGKFRDGFESHHGTVGLEIRW